MIIYQVVAEPRKDQTQFGRAVVWEIETDTPENAIIEAGRRESSSRLTLFENGKIEVEGNK